VEVFSAEVPVINHKQYAILEKRRESAFSGTFWLRNCKKQKARIEGKEL
jgi:hypothetical protein